MNKVVQHGLSLEPKLSYPKPPSDLDPALVQYWNSLVQAKEPDRWPPSDLTVLAKLCRLHQRYDRASAVIEQEGELAPDRFGVMKLSQNFFLARDLLKQITATHHFLKIDSGNASKPTARAHRAAAGDGQSDEDDLIA